MLCIPIDLNRKMFCLTVIFHIYAVLYVDRGQYTANEDNATPEKKVPLSLNNHMNTFTLPTVQTYWGQIVKFVVNLL